jgi:hypothetical protein
VLLLQPRKFDMEFALIFVGHGLCKPICTMRL